MPLLLFGAYFSPKEGCIPFHGHQVVLGSCEETTRLDMVLVKASFGIASFDPSAGASWFGSSSPCHEEFMAMSIVFTVAMNVYIGLLSELYDKARVTLTSGLTSVTRRGLHRMR